MVDTTKVWANINRAIAKYSSSTDEIDRTWSAFRLLQAERNLPGNSVDQDLAAAEWYMFSKSMVSSAACSLYQMRAQARLYYLGKVGTSVIPGLEQAMRHNKANPMSKPSAEVLDWAILGADDGYALRQKVSPGLSAPFFSWKATKY